MKKLTDKQKRFVEEYLIDYNATRAASKAGYAKKIARVQGSENLTKPDIKSEINKRLEKKRIENELTEKKIIKELEKIAFSDITNYYNNELEVKDIDELPKEFTAAIKEIVKIETNRGIRTTIKLYSKENALELLGKHLGIFKNEQTDNEYRITIKDETEE